MKEDHDWLPPPQPLPPNAHFRVAQHNMRTIHDEADGEWVRVKELK